jgi:phytanoyl-CoA hydroxylase
MHLSAEQLAQYQQNGFLVLEGFVKPDACKRVREQAGQLVEAFDPDGMVSVFSTQEQSHLRDDYFLGSETRFVSSLKRMPFYPLAS